MSHEEHRYLLDFRSFEDQLEDALFFPTQQLCTTQSCFFRDELGALFHGDISSFWPDLEQGAHQKGEKELKQEVGGDDPEKTREGSEETLLSSTQYLCTSTTTAQSCLSQALEGDHHKGEKDLKQDLGRVAWVKKRKLNASEEKPLLTFQLLSQYYCMPIKQAAEELNVGLTHLKRRCRELGIPRWPHRQVKSLERLIKNVQELGWDTGEQGGLTKAVVDMLQQAKKLIEESPADVELDHWTKVLRQAFFKENYKRRRLMAIEG
ncbi:unnamed protein product [Alopecurus aequalis]